MLLGHTQIITYAPQRSSVRDALSREIFVKLLPVYADPSAYLCNGGMTVTYLPEIFPEALMNTHACTICLNLGEHINKIGEPYNTKPKGKQCKNRSAPIIEEL